MPLIPVLSVICTAAKKYGAAGPSLHNSRFLHCGESRVRRCRSSAQPEATDQPRGPACRRRIHSTHSVIPFYVYHCKTTVSNYRSTSCNNSRGRRELTQLLTENTDGRVVITVGHRDYSRAFGGILSFVLLETSRMTCDWDLNRNVARGSAAGGARRTQKLHP